jgi:probable HAF family extracellular repeat protein
MSEMRFQLVACLLFLTAVIAHADSAAYTIHDLSTLQGGSYSAGYGINGLGEVVGYGGSYIASSRAFEWNSSNGMQDIGALAGKAKSRAYDINDSGHIAGYSYNDATDPVACLWTSGGITNLGMLPGGTRSAAVAINRLGQVVGQSKTVGATIDRAFLWLPAAAYGLPSGLNNLGTLVGDAESEAQGINGHGQVVGFSSDSTGFDQAFLWLPASAYGLSSGMNNLGSLGNKASAADINDLGQVVGYSYTTTGSFHAFLWENGIMTDLGVPNGGTNSEALGINNAGQVVGYYTTTNPNVWRGFVWDSLGGFQDIGTLAGDTESVAYDINDHGEIVGASWLSGAADDRAVLWQPVPEPSSIAALIGGLIWMMGVRRRKQ